MDGATERRSDGGAAKDRRWAAVFVGFTGDFSSPVLFCTARLVTILIKMPKRAVESHTRRGRKSYFVQNMRQGVAILCLKSIQ